METRTVRTLHYRVLLASAQLSTDTAVSQACRAIAQELESREIEVVPALNALDGESDIFSDASLDAVLLDWELEHAAEAIVQLRRRNKKIPVFLLQSRTDSTSLPLEIMEHVDETVWLLEDTAPFIAGRIEAAIQRYIAAINPPLFRDMLKFNDLHEYSWHTPGHTGGVAFLKTAVSKSFYEYFGENLFRSDLSISVGELGSLLDHSGSIGESEKYIARVFGADRSYSVTNGSSTSNRIIYLASVTAGDIAVCDRNCHKSVEQALSITGALPVYLIPRRNYLGIIGPIPSEQLTQESLQHLIATSPLTGSTSPSRAQHVTITNSTYDGVCYNARRAVELLSPSVDRIHFDEAWYGYARFHPMYADRYAMHGEAADYPEDAPTIFAVQSTHKLLAALSQASYIHVRDGRQTIEHDRFNESFMMNASTSPLYPMIASNEIAAAMMDESGEVLVEETIEEAIDFRQTVMRYNRQLAANGDWFFTTWNPDEVTDPHTGQRVAFADADKKLLSSNPDAWVLHPNEDWHGYGQLEDGYAMLDPIKVSVVTPGVNRDGTMADWGIPAMLLVSYLDAKGIVNEKTTDFTVLFLFSMGITKGKWGTLLNALLEFKRDYDVNAPLEAVMPALVEANPDAYRGMGLKQLSDEMFAQMKSTQQTQIQSAAFETLPHPDMTPQAAYQHLVHDQVEQISLDQLANRTLATGIVPYPPGIPLLMPGENAGPADGPVVGYLKALQAFDRKFPGFGHDTHGVENKDGTYMVYCLKQQSRTEQTETDL